MAQILAKTSATASHANIPFAKIFVLFWDMNFGFFQQICDAYNPLVMTVENNSGTRRRQRTSHKTRVRQKYGWFLSRLTLTPGSSLRTVEMRSHHAKLIKCTTQTKHVETSHGNNDCPRGLGLTLPALFKIYRKLS